MFKHYRFSPANETRLSHVIGTHTFSAQRAELFCRFGGRKCPPHTVGGRHRTAEDRDLRGFPDGPLLDIDGRGVPFGFAQGRLSTARDRHSDAHAPLGMTERKSGLHCGAA
jgi:hypothetical protein